MQCLHVAHIANDVTSCQLAYGVCHVQVAVLATHGLGGDLLTG